MSVDPLVEQTGQAYIGMGNNPVNLVDPDGRAAYPPEDGIALHIDEDGVFRWNDSKGAYEHYAWGEGGMEYGSTNGFSGYWNDKVGYLDRPYSGAEQAVRYIGKTVEGLYTYTTDDMISPITETGTTLLTTLAAGLQGAGTALYESLQGKSEIEVQMALNNTEPLIPVGGLGFENGRVTFHNFSEMTQQPNEIENYFLGNAIEAAKGALPIFKIFNKAPYLNRATTGGIIKSFDARDYELIEDAK